MGLIWTFDRMVPGWNIVSPLLVSLVYMNIYFLNVYKMSLAQPKLVWNKKELEV